MSTLLALVLATASWNPDGCAARLAVPAGVLLEDGSTSPAQGTERVVIHKDGGPGRGPDQPYSVREQGATDLEGFVGGKYVVFAGPWDVIVLALIVVLVVVLIVVL
jgi:hypothetical protein